MKNKVTVAIYDADLRVKLGKYPISENGKQIVVQSGGAAHHMPKMGPTNFLDFPKTFLGWNTGYERIYIVEKMGDKCVDFKTGETFGPDPETIDAAIASTMLHRVGAEKPAVMPFLTYLMLGLNVLIALKVLGIV